MIIEEQLKYYNELCRVKNFTEAVLQYAGVAMNLYENMQGVSTLKENPHPEEKTGNERFSGLTRLTG